MAGQLAVTKLAVYTIEGGRDRMVVGKTAAYTLQAPRHGQSVAKLALYALEEVGTPLVGKAATTFTAGAAWPGDEDNHWSLIPLVG